MAIKAVGVAAKVASDLNIKDLGKSLAIFATVGAIFALIMLAGRMPGMSPLLLTYAKILVSMWVFLKIFFWMMDKLNEYSEEQVDRAMGILKKIFWGLIILSVTMKALKVLSSGLTFMQSGRSGGNDISKILLAIAAMMVGIGIFIKAVNAIPLYKLEYVVETVTYAFSMVGKLVLAAMLINKIPTASVEKATVKIGGIIAAVGFSVLTIVLALAIAGAIPHNVIMEGYERIIALYAVIGGIAIALLFVDRFFGKQMKTVAASFKGGIKSQSFMKSNIGSVILAITVSTLAMTLSLKYLAGLNETVFARGAKRAFILFGSIAAIAAALLLIDKIGNSGRKAMFKPVGLVITMTLSILAIVWALYELSTIETGPLVKASIIMTIIVGIIIGFLIGFVAIAKWYQKGKQSFKLLKQLTVIMIVFVASILLIMGAIFAISKFGEPKYLWSAMGIFMLVSMVIAGFIVGIMAIASNKKFKMPTKTVLTRIVMTIIVLVSAVILIMGTIFAISKFGEPKKLWSVTGIFILVTAVILAMFLGFAAITSNKKFKMPTKSVLTRIVMTIIILVSAIIIIMGAIFAVSKFGEPKKLWAVTGIFMIVTTTILAMLLGFAAITGNKKFKMPTKSVLTRIVMTIIILVAAVILIMGAILLVSRFGEPRKLWAVTGIFMTISATILAMLLAFMVIVNKVKMPTINKMIKAFIIIGTLLFFVGEIIVFIGILTVIAQFLDGKKVGIIAATLGIMLGVITLIGIMCVIANKFFGDIISGAFAFAVIEFLLLGLVAIAGAMTIIVQFMDAKKVGLMAAILGVMIGAVLLIGALCVVASKFLAEILLGILAVAPIVVLLFGLSLIALIMAQVVKDMNGKKVGVFAAVLGIMIGAVLLIGVLCAALSFIAPYVLIGAGILAIIEVLLLGLVGISYLAAKVVEKFGTNIQALADSIKGLGDALRQIRDDVSLEDVRKLKLVAQAINELADIKFKKNTIEAFDSLVMSMNNLDVDRMGSFVVFFETLKTIPDSMINFANSLEYAIRIIQTNIDGYSLMIAKLTEMRDVVNGTNYGNIIGYVDLFNAFKELAGLNLDPFNASMGVLLGKVNSGSMYEIEGFYNTLATFVIGLREINYQGLLLLGQLFGAMVQATPALDLFNQAIQKLGEIISDDNYEISLTVTPVWNYTSDFLEGMAEFDRGIGLYNEAKKTQGAFNEYNQSKNSSAQSGDISSIGQVMPGMNVTINQQFTDVSQYGLMATRSTGNAVTDALNGVKNGIKNAFLGVFKR